MPIELSLEKLTVAKNVFVALFKLLKQKQNLVPRECKIVGGMRSVETYRMFNVTLQIMDEGNSNHIFTNNVSVMESPKGIEIAKGDLMDLRHMLLFLGTILQRTTGQVNGIDPYVMLCNVEKSCQADRKQAKQMMDIFPLMKSLPYGYLGAEQEKSEEYTSLWIPLSSFLVAWTFYNHADLKNSNVTILDGKEYLDIQLRDGYIRMKEEFQNA